MSAVEAGHWGLAHGGHADGGPHQLGDGGDAVVDHRGPLEGEAPGHDLHVLGEPHGPQHLRPEHARVADLDPLLELRVVPENLHRGLGVGVVGRLEPQLLYPDLREELGYHALQVAESQSSVQDEPLHLVELSQVRLVYRLVPEHSVDRKELAGSEVLGRRDREQGLGRHRCGVGPEDVLLGLRLLPVVVVAQTTKPSLLVDLLYGLPVVRVADFRFFRGGDEEGVVCVAGRVVLGLEQTVEIPERTLDVLVSFHLLEPHFQQDLPELLPHLHERVLAATVDLDPGGLQVERPELLRLPAALGQHLAGEVRDQSHLGRPVLRPLAHSVVVGSLQLYQLPRLQVLEVLFLQVSELACPDRSQSRGVLVLHLLHLPLYRLAPLHRHPLLLHADGKPELEHFAQLFRERVLLGPFRRNAGEQLELRSSAGVLEPEGRELPHLALEVVQLDVARDEQPLEQSVEFAVGDGEGIRESQRVRNVLLLQQGEDLLLKVPLHSNHGWPTCSPPPSPSSTTSCSNPSLSCVPP